MVIAKLIACASLTGSVIDNYLSEYDLFIEVMGDYWHASPLRYGEQRYLINTIQQRTLQHDKQKRTYIKNHFHKDILYLWETDVNRNEALCEKLIREYIRTGGRLEDYHSFNYHLDGDRLVLNNKIITPYQDMRIDMYRHLLKEKVG